MRVSQIIACARSLPHISADGASEAQTAGRSGRPNRRQRKAASRCGQGRPAGLPRLLIDGAMQQAPQPGLQFMAIDDLATIDPHDDQCSSE
jgi:hypothetical protein